MIDYEKLLNPAQLEAASTLDGPVLVVAGAGSGKTRTLVFRLARLVESGVAPERVLLLTFTRKAAEEMLFRAGDLADQACRKASGGTFHALAHLWLRRLAPRIGYPRQFHILDRADSESIIASLREDLKIKSSQFPKKRTLADLFSRAVNHQRSLTDLVETDAPHLLRFSEQMVALDQAFRDYKRQAGLMDFDDLLVKMIEAMETDEAIRLDVAGRYSHVMVDEYQDTNPLQVRLVQLWSHGHDNVMAVGDDSQSIYAFRGADYRNMMAFPDQFPGTRIIKLEQNYRSYQPILSVANAVIARASQTFTKCLTAVREGGDKPDLHEPLDDADQSRFVVEQIERFQSQGIGLDEMAVLFRSGFHSFDLEVALNRSGIPFAKYGGLRFAEAAHVKDVLSFLKARLNPKDSLSLSRMLMLLPGVGPKKSRDIIAWLQETETPLTALDQAPGAGKATAGLSEIASLMTALEQAEGRGPAEEVSLAVEFYTPMAAKAFDDYPRRLRELEQIVDLAHNYRSTYRFLADLSLDPPTTLYSDEGANQDRLILSTVHSAKGLEWKVVFLLWAVEGRLPSQKSLLNEEALEEERRLMYVAVTRAKDRLFILSPKRSFSHHQGVQFHGPSRFVSEAREHLAAWRPEESVPAMRAAPTVASAGATGAGAAKARNPVNDPRPLTKPAGAALAVGTKVDHAAFGRGVVRGYLGAKQIVVEFPGLGHKTLHLDYARLVPAGD